MGFQARLCFFFFLTFAIMCFAREAPLGTEKNLVVEDYDGPKANPKHDPPRPPPKQARATTSSKILTQRDEASP